MALIDDSTDPSTIRIAPEEIHGYIDLVRPMFIEDDGEKRFYVYSVHGVTRLVCNLIEMLAKSGAKLDDIRKAVNEDGA